MKEVIHIGDRQPLSLQAGCDQAAGLLNRGQAGQAWALLAQLADVFPPHPLVLRLQGAVLAAVGQHEPALARYRAALALAPDDSQAMAILGGGLQQLGQLPQALQHYRSALVQQCARPLRLALAPPALPFDESAAEVRLWQVLTQLARQGVHAFAAAGTLLGLVREGKLLPGDKDLDVGLPFAEMETALQWLLANGWQRARAPDGMVNPVMLHDGQGLALDLCGFVAGQDNQSALGGFWLKNVPGDWQRVTEYPPLHLHQQRRPEGMVWSVTDPEAWLAALYGPDWRIPDPDFDTVIAANNLRGFSLLTQCYAFSRIYERWLQGRLGKALSLVRHSLRHLPDDDLLQRCAELLSRQMAAEHKTET